MIKLNQKQFENRKKEINCNICCTDFLYDICKNINKNEFDDKTEIAIQQLCQLFSYVENRIEFKTKINVLKFYRKINYKSENKGCYNCFFGIKENDGSCMNVYGIEGICSEINNDFLCKNYKRDD